jgi:uncharacterized protein with NRDE domain
MCLIVFAVQSHPQRPLLVAANRDEFYRRPSAALEIWPEDPQVMAGRDLQGGGTWMGVGRDGRWAAVTNVRNPRDMQPGRRSRGWLVRDYLLGENGPGDFLERLQAEADAFPGFNLLVGAGGETWYFSNRSGTPPQRLAPGIYALSNALLNTPWPKVEGTRKDLAELLAAPEPPGATALYDLLAHEKCAADEALPDTGVSREWERILSARFIRSKDYGTRCSTLLQVSCSGQVEFCERSFATPGPGWRERCLCWRSGILSSSIT